MASSKCSVAGCKRDFDTLCAHCHSNVCSKHYIEHVKLANDELIPLADQLNSIINSIQQHDPLHQPLQQLEQWREMNHQHIDKLYNDKKRELQAEVQEKIDKQMQKLCELSREVKELIDEGDASFKQIENIKREIEACQEQCKQFERADYLRLHFRPSEIKSSFVDAELFTGGGTLLSLEQRKKLNEFYGKQDQEWMLIYKATRDGFGSNDFHRCCNKQGATITVIRSKDGGYLFGGYTSVSWRSIEAYVADNYGPFLYTLTNPHGIPPTRYSIENVLYAICDRRDRGPSFGGGHDLHVCDNSHTNAGSYFKFPHSYNDTTNRGSMTFTGDSKYLTSEIEVYRLMKN